MNAYCNNGECLFRFGVYDQFQDALDLRDRNPGNQEISLVGNPYSITHEWSKSIIVEGGQCN